MTSAIVEAIARSMGIPKIRAATGLRRWNR